MDLSAKWIFAKVMGLPQALMIEPTDVCNLKCTFCYTQNVELKRMTHTLSLEKYKDIIQDVRRYCMYINFWFAGEPLINKDIYKFVDHANRNNILSCISSNGMLLTPQASHNLIEAGLDRIIISFDGANKETYEKIRVGAKFETVIENVRKLVQLKKELKSRKPYVSLQMVLTKDNEQEVEKFTELAKDLGVDQAYVKSLYTFDTQDKEVKDKIKALQTENNQRTSDSEERKAACTANNRTAILCDGTVVPCCYDVDSIYKFGDVGLNSLTDIWESSEYKIFRKDNKKFKESPLCSKCGCKKDFSLKELI